MTEFTKTMPPHDLRDGLDTLIAAHGAWRVLAAALKGLVRPRRRAGPPAEDVLSDHLRRDIGLSPTVRAGKGPFYLP